MKLYRNDWSSAKFVSIGGVLVAITVIFQSAPVFLPMIGLAISPLSTLPIALAAYLSIPLGIAAYLSSAVILTFVYLQESLILLFTTGLIGVTIGAFLFRKGIVASILFSSIALSISMYFVTYIVGIALFGELTSSQQSLYTFFVFFLFSFVYTSIWSFSLKKFIQYFFKKHGDGVSASIRNEAEDPSL